MTSSSLDRLGTALITIWRLSDRRLPRNRRSGCRKREARVRSARLCDQFPTTVYPKWDSPDPHPYTAHYRLYPLHMRNCNRRRIGCFVGYFWFPSTGGKIDGRLCTCQGGNRGTRIGVGKLASAELRGSCVRPHPRRRRCRRRMRYMKRTLGEMTSSRNRNRTRQHRSQWRSKSRSSPWLEAWGRGIKDGGTFQGQELISLRI